MLTFEQCKEFEKWGLHQVLKKDDAYCIKEQVYINYDNYKKLPGINQYKIPNLKDAMLLAKKVLIERYGGQSVYVCDEGNTQGLEYFSLEWFAELWDVEIDCYMHDCWAITVHTYKEQIGYYDIFPADLDPIEAVYKFFKKLGSVDKETND